MSYYSDKSERPPAVICVLEETDKEKSGDRSIEAGGLLAKMDLQFTGLLVTLTRLYGEAKCLSNVLQSPYFDLGLGVDLVEALIQTFKDCSDETYFEEYWKQVVHTAEQCHRTDTQKTENAKQKAGWT